MDELWNTIAEQFDTILDFLPYHSRIIKMITHLVQGNIDSATNILLHGQNGFPMNLIWETVFLKMFGQKYIKKHVMWQNSVSYFETPYFFEIDMSDPYQPKDIEVLSNFIKEIIQHPCVFNQRHIIVMRNIDKGCVYTSGYSFRVLLERFSSNVLFICATTNACVIERPIVSRCITLRVPLATNKQLAAIFTHLGFTFHPLLVKYDCRDLYFALYIHWLHVNTPNSIHENMFKYRVHGFDEFIKNKSTLTIDDIRTFTAKICVHDVSFDAIVHDILQHIRCVDNKMKFTVVAAQIEHLCACTEGYRKPLYVELLINVGILGMNNKHIPNVADLLKGCQ